MTLFSKLQKPEETASSVRKAFETRIEGFLREVDAPTGILGQRDKTLNGVFNWGRKVLNDKRVVEHSLDDYERAYRSSLSQIEELKNRLQQTQAQLQERDGQLQHAESTIQQMSLESSKMQAGYEDMIALTNIEHIQTVRSIQDQHELEAAQLRSECEQKEKERKMYHEDQERRLVGQLLTSQNDNGAWPDDKLKYKFSELRQLIDSTTSPRNKEFRIPDSRAVGSRLDPTNFIARVGSGKGHYLLKSAIWKILQEQFFSIPFGFGVFGPEKVPGELMKVYFTWRELFDMKNRKATSDDIFALLRNDRIANTWRSATFQTINEALAADGTLSHSESLLAQFSAENTQIAADRVNAVLLGIAKLSGNGLRKEVEEQVHEMVHVTSQIAIQFGVHTAQLQLLLPAIGEKVEIGESYHDCEDGDYNKGTVYTVDVVVVPGLQRIGDGRHDMTSKRSIVPCEIFPAES
ncbi:hypothetical protein BU16DRAFT_561296 [Lophium mytilinum]|uniref:Uncharacterized protein n=1 Tax=Lophium mytilinum TaxID=390894 RepID=A0A6A6QXD5_9PEZI|nr:hypothetical protein BU16DRAFT_561296 [Lophium mytilinum]